MSTLLASPRLAFLKKDSYMTRLIIVFLLLLIFFAAVRPGPFFAVRTWQSMAVQFPEFGLMSLGVMFTMFTAGIDLSVVAIANVTSICAALTLRSMLGSAVTSSSMGMAVLIALGVALVVGVVCGLINGTLVAVLKIPPILATLGTLELFGGVALIQAGEEAFEGLKAFMGKDGRIRVFRMDENAKRLQASSRAIMMAELPVEKFEEAVRRVVLLNKRFVPPYGSGSSLYIRPLLIGTGAQVGVKPATEYLFVIFVTPVGPYFKTGFRPSKVCIMRGYDRAAPHGTGMVKITPAHDPNDFEIAKRHDLPLESIISPEGKMINVPAQFLGLTPVEARARVLEALEALELRRGETEIEHAVGHCYKCGSVIEPMIKEQWFIKTQSLAQPAIDALKKEEITWFFS